MEKESPSKTIFDMMAETPGITRSLERLDSNIKKLQEEEKLETRADWAKQGFCYKALENGFAIFRERRVKNTLTAWPPLIKEIDTRWKISSPENKLAKRIVFADGGSIKSTSAHIMHKIKRPETSLESDPFAPTLDIYTYCEDFSPDLKRENSDLLRITLGTNSFPMVKAYYDNNGQLISVGCFAGDINPLFPRLKEEEEELKEFINQTSRMSHIEKKVALRKYISKRNVKEKEIDNNYLAIYFKNGKGYLASFAESNINNYPLSKEVREKESGSTKTNPNKDYVGSVSDEEIGCMVSFDADTTQSFLVENKNLIMSRVANHLIINIIKDGEGRPIPEFQTQIPIKVDSGKIIDLLKSNDDKDWLNITSQIPIFLRIPLLGTCYNNK